MIRIAPALTALTLLAAPVAALDLNTMTDAEREAFRAEVRAYLLENPEVIIEAVSLLEQRQAQAEAMADKQLIADYADEIFDDGYSWVGGNPDGDITLVEFLDYRCGYCRRAFPEVTKLMHADGNIRMIIKEYPILGEASTQLSRFAIATKQIEGADAYKEVHDTLMSFNGEPTEVALRRLADGLGMDADAILIQMEHPDVEIEIERSRSLARKLKISGTPSFILEDELLRGFLPADQMAAIIAELRAE